MVNSSRLTHYLPHAQMHYKLPCTMTIWRFVTHWEQKQRFTNLVCHCTYSFTWSYTCTVHILWLYHGHEGFAWYICPSLRARAYISGRILNGHGITVIFHYGALTKSFQGNWKPHHQFYTQVSELRSWVHKTWAVVPQNVLGTSAQLFAPFLKTRLWVSVVLVLSTIPTTNVFLLK